MKALMAAKILVAGRYLVERKLGSGGMGETLLALDQVLDRRVVIKRPINPKYQALFAKEAKAQAALNHTNAVKIYDFGVEAGQPYLVMEWIAGWDLHRLIHRAGPISQERATYIIRAIGQAVAHGHVFGILHRDIKPNNILIGSDGVPRLADFGLAKLPSMPMTGDGQGLGTPIYAAPEQMKGLKKVDERADIYALGMTLLAMLSGQPFPEQRQVLAGVSPEFRAAIARCLELKPSNRFPSVEAFLDALPPPNRSRAPSNLVGTQDALRHISSHGGKPVRKKDHVELAFNLGDIRLSGKGEFRTILGFCFIPTRKVAAYVIYMHEKKSLEIKRAAKALLEYSPMVSVDESVIDASLPLDDSTF